MDVLKRTRLRTLISLGAIVALSLVAGSSTASAAPVPGQLIVAFSSSDHAKAHQAAGASVVDSIPALGIDVVRVQAGREATALGIYRRLRDVRYAEQDQTVEALADPGYSRQWYLENNSATLQPDGSFITDADIDAEAAWSASASAGASRVKVAVLDTGIDQDHEDLKNKIIAQRNFSSSRTLDDKYGHGTHVAGIIAAIGNNGVGVAGIAPNADLLNGKVLGDNGSGTCSGVANGISWAADQINSGPNPRVGVISLSLGGGACTAEANAVAYASSKNSLVVAAAGNSSTTSQSYPAAYEPALAVAATDNSDLLSSFSNYGTWVDIAAPGENIYSTLTNHRSTLSNSASYGYLSGTSMATPVVSAVAALLAGSDTSLNYSGLRDRLRSYADLPASVMNKIAGGRVNACRAISLAASCP